MRGRKLTGRLLAGLLAVVMLFTSVPSSVYAEEAASEISEMEERENVLEEPEEEEPEERETIPEERTEEESDERKETGSSMEDDKEQTEPSDSEEISGIDGNTDEELPDDAEYTENMDTDSSTDENSAEEVEDEEDTLLSGDMSELEEETHTDLQSVFSVKGTNSFGYLLEDALADKAEEQLENNGYNVFSVEMKGSTAFVSFETLEDAVLTIGIYDEEKDRLVASGSQEVFAEERTAYIEIAEKIPQYYYVRGFLTDKKTQQPLCTLYESSMYTQEMQEFLALTVDDFDKDRVLNLDDDKTNNFAVYNDEVVTLDNGAGVNRFVEADEEEEVYVIENADETVASLKYGDIFVYEYEEGSILIVKVAEITVDGSTVRITGENLELDEVFDYVKIDTEAGIKEAEIDASGLEEGISYEGIVDYQEGDISTYAFDGEGKVNAACSFKLRDVSNAKLSGSVDLKLEASVKVYISVKYQYLELKLDYSSKISCSLSGGLTGNNALKLALASVGFSPVPGVYIELTPSLVLDVEGKLELSGTLSGTVGFAVSSDEGAKNLTSTPKFKSEIKVAVTVFVGFSLEPKVKIVSDKIASVSVEASVGAEIEAVLAYKESSSSKVHGCVSCIDGDISGKVKVSFKAQLLQLDKLTFKVGTEFGIKIKDFYYSIDFNEFDFTECPHYVYQIEVNVSDEKGSKIKDVVIKAPFYVHKDGNNQTITSMKDAVNADYIMTGDDGKAVGYLPSGDYTLEISGNNYKTIQKEINIEDQEKKIWLMLTISGGGSGEESGGESGEKPEEEPSEKPEEKPEIKPEGTMLSLGYGHSGVVMPDGSLYMWGRNGSGQLGNGTTVASNTPVKVLDNVVSVSLGDSHSGAITSDGSLYMWGNNSYGQLGNGTRSGWSSTPIKVMDNVAFVSLGQYHSGAVTSDGSLYMWGKADMGQLGIEPEMQGYPTPIKVLDDVVSVSLGGEHSGAVTSDGSLYMWGDNDRGQLGCGTLPEWSFTPEKILDNVVSVSLGYSHSGAIRSDGSLYMWGDNIGGDIGLGSGDEAAYTAVPKKVLDNVVSVSLGWYYSGAITSDGNLYMWGVNDHGQLGDGEQNVNNSRPEKILGNVESVSLGQHHSGVVTLDRSLYMWGNNDYGQLGNGTQDASTIPVKVLDNILSISYKTSTRTTSIDAENVTETFHISANTTAVATGTTGNARFFGLVPGETYNFYAVETREKENPLEASNLLYINQYIADDSGSLGITYEAKRHSDSAVTFIVGKSKIPLQDADVNIPDLIADGSSDILYAVPEVSYRGVLLTEGVDYEITDNEGGSAAGIYSVTLSGLGLYTGEVTANYRILENPATESEQRADTLKPPTANIPSGTSVDAGTKVRLSADAVGTEIYYTLDGSYPDKKSKRYDKPIVIEKDTTIIAYAVRQGWLDSETVTFQYTVTDVSDIGDIAVEDIPKDGVIPKGLWITEVEDQPYTGKAIKPTVRVYHYKTLLTEKKDYTLSYKNNVKANDGTVAKTAPSITVTGRGNYAGKDTQTFVILPKNLLDEDVDADAVVANATGNIQNPVPKVVWNGKSLAKNKDFTVSYPNSGQGAYIENGTYTILVEGKGNFIGKKYVDFTITDLKLISGLKVGKIANQKYTGKPVTPTLTVKDGKETLKEGTDYQVAYFDNRKAGIASAVITGMGDYAGTKKVTFKIMATSSLNKASAALSFDSPAVYTGNEVKPDHYSLTITMKNADKQTVSVGLKEGTDYKVSYKNHIKAGTATVIFTGINGYSGTLKKTYKIAPYDMKADVESPNEADKRIMIQMKDSYEYAKGGCKPEPTITFDGKLLKKGTDYTLSYQNNKKLNDGSDAMKQAIVTIKGKGNFKGSCIRTYRITKQSLEKLTLTASDKVWKDKKNIYKTTITLRDMDGKKLSAGQDFDKNILYTYEQDTVLDDNSVRKAGTVVSEEDIISAGTMIKVTIHALESGNYTGSISSVYRITTADISKATIKIPVQIYTGKAIEPEEELEIKLQGESLSTDDYEIVKYSNNINAGTATMTIRGKSNCGGTKVATFKIKKKSFLWWWR